MAGSLLTDLNMLHPFREGNGRTQREFVRRLSRYHGFELDYAQMDAAAYMVPSVSDSAEEMARVWSDPAGCAGPDTPGPILGSVGP